jgi:predicted Zn finger-like uncharacterized protein
VNVACPECRSIFRVDPSRLPSTTVRARCSVCGGVISISEGSSIAEEFASKPIATSGLQPTSRAAAPQTPESWRSTASATPRNESFAPAQASRADDGMSVGATSSGVDAAVAVSSRSSVAPSLPAPSPVPARPVPNEAAVPPRQQPAPPVAKTGVGPGQGRPMLFPPRPMMPAGSTAGASARPIVAPPRTSGQVPAPQVAPSASRPAPQQALPSIPATTNSAPPSGPAPVAPAVRPAPSNAAAASPTPGRAPINPFLANDPHAKAKRLARALVSDLVTYFPQKCEEGLRDGTLKQLFKEEIQKSYEEYVGQVGREFAETTPHFQEALNDILARGQKVF